MLEFTYLTNTFNSKISFILWPLNEREKSRVWRVGWGGLFSSRQMLINAWICARQLSDTNCISASQNSIREVPLPLSGTVAAPSTVPFPGEELFVHWLSGCMAQNDKLGGERIGKEAVTTSSRYHPGIWLEGMRKIKINLFQDSRSPNRNKKTPNYKCGALPLCQPARTNTWIYCHVYA
jgi:hypothetical protein